MSPRAPPPGGVCVCFASAGALPLAPPPPLARCVRRARRARQRVSAPRAALPAVPAIAAGVAAGAAKLANAGTGLGILSAIIAIHELGHLAAAKLQGIEVKNFSIGFGPALLSRTAKDGTEYTLRALPLGGFVSFPENVREVDGVEVVDDDPNLLQNRPVLDRAIVVSAGVIANLVLAWVAVFASTTIVGQAVYEPRPGVVIAAVVDAGGAGAQADLRQGDVLLAVDGVALSPSLDSANALASSIRTSRGRPMDFLLRRGDSELALTVAPRCCTPDGNSALGVQLVPNATLSRARPESPADTLAVTNREFSKLSAQTVSGITSIFGNFKESSGNLTGPIGVVAMGANIASNERASLLTFVAVISINLAVINAAPIPALDGGQAVFLLIEALRGGRPVPPKVQDAVNRTALLLFLVFSGVVFLNDVERLSVLGSLKNMMSG